MKFKNLAFSNFTVCTLAVSLILIFSGEPAHAQSCAALFDLTPKTRPTLKEEGAELVAEIRRSLTPLSRQTSMNEVVQRVRAVVDEVIAGVPPENGGWSHRLIGCLPYSRQLRSELLRHIADVKLMKTESHQLYVVDGDFQVVKAVHFFLRYRAPNTREDLIIDPTYLQFFKNGAQLDLPEIFVGTFSDLVELFVQHRDQLRLNLVDRGALDPYVTAKNLYLEAEEVFE